MIESLLLGIPVPSIFVFEKEDSKWELIDGLQRISTLLEFMGILKRPGTKDPLPPSILEGTSYLPSLSNTVWEKSDLIPEVPFNQQSELGKSLQLAIRRSRLTVEILKRPSSNSTKYDLFQRLNAGTPANPQELRNCVVIMANSHYFQFMKSLADNKDFQNVIAVTSDQIEKQKHIEYLSRFLVHAYVPYDGKLDIEEFIDLGLVTLATANETAVSSACFNDTFKLLNELYGGDALRRITNGEASGRVGLATFECIAIGIAKNIQHILGKADPKAFVKERIQHFWEVPNMDQFFTPGLRGTTRIQRTIPFGEGWFSA